jgi:hypothetical protein
MTETATQRVTSVTKADVERFLLAKHITNCPACGCFLSKSDVDVQALDCHRTAQSASVGCAVDVLMIVCDNCGQIQFHDRAVVARWVENHGGSRGR